MTVTEFNPTKELQKAERFIKTSPVQRKSTNEVVKFLNSIFPENIRFKASSVRTSLNDLKRLGGIYKMTKTKEGLVIELFKNWHQMIIDQSNWYDKFVSIIGSNQDVNTYSKEAAERRKAALDNYSTSKKSEPKTAISIAMEDPKFKEMIARANLFNYSDGEEGDTKESRKVLWIYDFYKKLEKNKDLLMMDMPNFRSLMSRDYPGDYRIIGDHVVTSEKELLAFFRKLALKPVIRKHKSMSWFEYPSDQELANHGISGASVGRVYGTPRSSETKASGIKNYSISTKGDNPKDYGFKGSQEDADVLKIFAAEFWKSLQDNLDQVAYDPVNIPLHVLQEQVRELIYGQGDKIAKGQTPKHPEWSKFKVMDRLTTDYFRGDRFKRYKAVLKARKDGKSPKA